MTIKEARKQFVINSTSALYNKETGEIAFTGETSKRSRRKSFTQYIRLLDLNSDNIDVIEL